VITNATAAQIALFEENCSSWNGVDVELRSVRVYPHSNTAAHVLGYVKRDTNRSKAKKPTTSIVWTVIRASSASKPVSTKSCGVKREKNRWS